MVGEHSRHGQSTNGSRFLAGGPFAVAVDEKPVPLQGVGQNAGTLTGYAMLFGPNKAAAVAAAQEWTTSVVVDS